jgi:Rrf2 family cysteine metabolism transcriptional repressor
MRISTRGEYGTRAMLELALYHNQGPVTLKSIAERQGLSESYLEQLATALRKAGLIASTRGAQGGYQLARDPERITIGDIIRVLEGPISPVECAGETETAGDCCGNSGHCATRLFWQKLRDGIVDVLDSTTLADLAAKERELNKDGGMYYI